MTNNQNTYNANKEAERANKTRERETERSNRRSEGQRDYSNKTDRIRAIWGGINGTVANFVKAKGDAEGAAAKIVPAVLSGNDPKWYNLDPELVKTVANLPFGAPIGPYADKCTATNENGTLYGFMNHRTGIPGLWVLPFAPTIGYTNGTEVNAINTGAKLVYSYVRHANSGHTNYEANDMAKYLLAVDSAYYMYAEFCRLYSLLLEGKSHNWYYPEAMVNGLGYDYDDLVKKLPELRYQLNAFAMKINAFNIPNKFSLYSRHCWMASTMWKDSPVKKSQTYVFQPFGYFTYEEGDVAALIFHKLQKRVYADYGTNRNKLLKLDDIITVLNTIYSKLISSEDIGIMSGDILKAYGDGNLFKLTQIPDNYHIESQYNEEVLSQIKAATLLREDDAQSKTVSSLTIYGDSVGLLHQGMDNADGVYVLGSYYDVEGERSINSDGTSSYMLDMENNVLSFDHDDISHDEIMVATRLQASVSASGLITACGSEVIINSYLVITSADYATDMGLNVPLIYQPIYKNVLIEASMIGLYITVYLPFITAFDWAPQVIISYYAINDDHVDGYLAVDVFDYNNYYITKPSELSKLHNVALWSEFGISYHTTSNSRS